MISIPRTDAAVRRGMIFEFEIDAIRRGLNDAPRMDDVTAAGVSFETADGTAAGGPFAAAYDGELSAWVAVCPARTEAVDTVLVSRATWVIGAVTYTQAGTLRITA